MNLLRIDSVIDIVMLLNLGISRYAGIRPYVSVCLISECSTFTALPGVRTCGTFLTFRELIRTGGKMKHDIPRKINLVR